MLYMYTCNEIVTKQCDKYHGELRHREVGVTTYKLFDLGPASAFHSKP